jgi:hypothetical protein
MRRITLVAALVLALSPDAAAVQCQTTGKSWRLIDGRKCWTDRWMPKDKLSWAAPPRRIEMRRPPPRVRQPPPPPALETVPMPPPKAGTRTEAEPGPTTFEQRFAVSPDATIVPRRVRTILVGGPEVRPQAPPPPPAQSVRASLAAGLSALVLLVVLTAGGVAAFKWRG